MPKITALEIENFQSIRESMRIEFAPITLLFGPNSAGKSAVYDALELLECLWDPVRSVNENVEQMIDRWARRENGKYLPIRLAVEFKYNAADAGSDDIWSDDRNWKCGKARNDCSFIIDSFDDFEGDWPELVDTVIRLEIQIGFDDTGDSKESVPFLHGLSIKNRDQIILGYGSEIDPRYNSLPTKCYGYNGASVYIDSSSLFASYLWRESNLESDLIFRYGNERGCEVLVPRLNLTEVVAATPMWHWEGNASISQLQGYYNLYAQNVSDLIFYFGTIFGQIFRESSPVVKADRRVPSPTEALFVIDYQLGGWWNSQDRFAAASPANLLYEKSAKFDPHYQCIARSAHADLLLKAAKHDLWGSDHALKYLNEDISSESLYIHKVNEHLETNLFAEKLYRVECASTLMVPIDLGEDDPWSYYALAQPATVRLFLKDGEGRRVELQDVGSGIPFVLPVLYASVYGFLSRVQQPELHLHPALQAELADVFLIESLLNTDKQFIVETHSEHLVLRLLRRIRDTENGKPSSNNLPLTPNNIAIYYFEPQISGGTYIIKQAVTPLGDFYHDWPRGFFTDRDKDLFDE